MFLLFPGIIGIIFWVKINFQLKVRQLYGSLFRRRHRKTSSLTFSCETPQQCLRLFSSESSYPASCEKYPFAGIWWKTVRSPLHQPTYSHDNCDYQLLLISDFILFFPSLDVRKKSETILMRRKQMITSCRKSRPAPPKAFPTRQRETSYNPHTYMHRNSSFWKEKFSSLELGSTRRFHIYKKSSKFQLKWKRRPLNATAKFQLASQATTFAKESGADILNFWTNCSKILISWRKLVQAIARAFCMKNFI